MKRNALLASALVVVISAGIFAGSSISAASGTIPETHPTPLWVGDKPIFLTPDEAADMWSVRIQEEQKKVGNSFAFDTEVPLVLGPDPEGKDPVRIEQGLVNSVVARAVRCEKLETWLTDESLSEAEAARNAETDFEEFAAIPEIRLLGDIEGYRQLVKDQAAVRGTSDVESEYQVMCIGDGN